MLESNAATPAPAHRILVMDDEPAIRQLTVNILKRFGYECATAEDGEAAILLYTQAKQQGAPFHMVLLDLTIPGGKGGVETLQALKAIDPQVKGVMCSGYSYDGDAANWGDLGFVAQVSKPFRIEELISTLQKVLG